MDVLPLCDLHQLCLGGSLIEGLVFCGEVRGQGFPLNGEKLSTQFKN